MNFSSPVKVMMVAGEASGDLLGATLLADLNKKFSHLSVIGVGGAGMRANGLQGRFDINDLSVIGLVEAVQRFPRLIQVFRYLTGLLRSQRPSLLITIDLPDFNFFLAKQAKKLGIRVVHYVSPQVWAWRSGRVNKIARLLDHLMVLFPFEPILYQQTTLPVTFVGHPLVHLAVPSMDKTSVRRSLGVKGDEKLIVLLPGSRHGEIKRLLGVMVATCQKVKKRVGSVRFVLALADSIALDDLSAYWPVGNEGDLHGEDLPDIIIRQGQTYDLIAASDAALVTSGTATLETALLGTPMVVIYRVNALTYEIAKRVIQVPYISLANLVVDRELVPERIQDAADPDVLAQDLMQMLMDVSEIGRMQAGFQEIREKLSSPDCRAVDVVANLLGEQAV